MFKPIMFAAFTVLLFGSTAMARVNYLLLSGVSDDFYYELTYDDSEDQVAPEPISHKSFITKTTAMQTDSGSMYLPAPTQPETPAPVDQPEVRYMQCANGLCVMQPQPVRVRRVVVYRQAAAEPACGMGAYQAAEPACGAGVYAEAACGSGAYARAEASCGSDSYGAARRPVMARLRIFSRLRNR